ncbi:hypothetical protein BDV25DRAFT_153160, partial [Aspergillus avenaceus]
MEDNAELESFRRQWREEVAHRNKPSKTSTPQPRTSSSSTARPKQFPPSRHEASQRKEEEEEVDASASLDSGEIVQGLGHLSLATADDDAFQSQATRTEPKSALEHFERAVEKEAEGNLGDSLQHYRMAYRLDSTVDKTYRNKHFAWAWQKPAQAPVPSGNAPTKPQTKPQPEQDEPEVLSTPDLIASFAHLPIPQAEPLIENAPPPPCPIANVPSEVIVEILRHVALMDPAAFCRMSLVCKRFAWHFAHEQHVWKWLCQGSKFGFKGMHYTFACDIHGNEEHTLSMRPRYTPFPADAPAQIPASLSSWSQVFQIFPRIRFTGIYISTVNYTRAGAASAYQNASWNSPIHIVTYYRYLRFYPDGTVISLLTTVQPLDIVPHVSWENALAARAVSHKHHHRQVPDASAAAADPIPAVAMGALKDARKGRWRLANPFPLSDSASEGVPPEDSFPSLPDKASPADASDPRDIVIETESVSPKYTNLLYLSLRSPTAPKAANSPISPPNPSKNTKLVWKGYWSYDKLTDDWAEYGLRNDRAFVFRRVRGWGL